jgi:serine phosphatase RsbU (regulator of sigma subunit)
MEIRIAVAKINRFGASENSDSLEVIERPNGGISIILADGMSSNPSAKLVSSLVVRQVINMLADGVRDGAAARAASDRLYTDFQGRTTATLNILSVDLQTNTIVITRNNTVPVYLAQGEEFNCLGGESIPIGSTRNIRPTISEYPLQSGLTVVMYTDGLWNAGQHHGNYLDTCAILEALVEDSDPSSQEIADALLNHGIRLDDSRPEDDMSIVVMRTLPDTSSGIRRMSIQLPVIQE